MRATPTDIREAALFELLGDILRPDINPMLTGSMRLRLMRQGFSWQALIDLARGQGVLLPLIFALTARGLLPPIPRSIKQIDNHVTLKLGNIYAQHLARRQSEKTRLEAILAILEGAGIAPLILKGARYLLAPVASWCEARSMVDFDILLEPGDAERAFAVLTAEGYRQFIDGRHLSHHLPPIYHPDEPVLLEIHTHPLSAAGQKIMSAQHLWANATKAIDGNYFVLPIRWHALHGLLHHQVQDRGHIQRRLNVKALWEWAMLALAFTDDDWHAIRLHMRAAKASDLLDSWMMQSHRLFGPGKTGLPEISITARAHAEATFRRAFKPYWIRRTRFIADQLRVSFARETLAHKYDMAPSQITISHAARNMMDLLRRYRGNALPRLTGSRDQLW